MVWCETGTPDLDFARQFAEGIHRSYPGKLLAYNCSPSFNWKRNLDDATIAKFQRELGAMGYKFQFITLAGFHALNYGMFDLARGYARSTWPPSSSCRKPNSRPGARLHRDQAPARSRHRLLRRGNAGDTGRSVVGNRAYAVRPRKRSSSTTETPELRGSYLGEVLHA